MSPRHKQFDPDDALESALEVFWRQGFDATSVEDLVAAMGINRFSLYDTFGDKETLLLSALELYGTRLCETLQALQRSPTALAGVRSYFQETVRGLREEGCNGCLLTNCAVEVAGSHERARRILLSYLDRIEEAFYEALLRARREGDLRPGLTPRDGARFLLTSLQGLAVLARAGRADRASPAVVRVMLSALEG